MSSIKRIDTVIRERNRIYGTDDLNPPTFAATCAGVTITKQERIAPGKYRVALTVASFTQAVATAALGFGKEIYDFPQGGIMVNSANISIVMSAPTATNTSVIGLGSVVGSGAVSVLTGTATFVNELTSQAAAALTVAGTTTAVTDNGAAVLSVGAATAAKMFLNFAGTWNSTENLTISGTVEFEYSIL
jgi:hypothetical protein